MSGMSDLFRKAVGEPDPPAPLSLPFEGAAKLQWDATLKDMPAGWFQDRFLYFLGPGLEPLEACLDAWSWLIPKTDPDRVVLGRNAYGAIAFATGMRSGHSQVRILDPLTLAVLGDGDMDVVGFFARHVPKKLVPSFLDASAYQALSAPALGLDQCLAISLPLSLGGTMDPDNFELEDLIHFHETSARIYRRRQP
jgi:hypothetical protein